MFALMGAHRTVAAVLGDACIQIEEFHNGASDGNFFYDQVCKVGVLSGVLSYVVNGSRQSC